MNEKSANIINRLLSYYYKTVTYLKKYKTKLYNYRFDKPIVESCCMVGKAKYVLGEWGLKRDFGADNGALNKQCT